MAITSRKIINNDGMNDCSNKYDRNLLDFFVKYCQFANPLAIIKIKYWKIPIKVKFKEMESKIITMTTIIVQIHIWSDTASVVSCCSLKSVITWHKLFHVNVCYENVIGVHEKRCENFLIHSRAILDMCVDESSSSCATSHRRSIIIMS